jgi:transcription initiation factor TFIIB
MQRSIMCSVCNKAQTIITDPQSGEIICDSCGLVVLDKIPVRGLEWGTFVADGRTGIPSSLTRYDMGLSTVIGWKNKDSRDQVMNKIKYSLFHISWY